MKKLLALLLAALVLLSLPILPARADEDEPEAPAAAESPAEPAADPTEPPAPAETPDPTEPPAPAETPAPTEPAAEEAPAPADEPDPTEAPAPADEPDPTEAPAPADEPDPTEAPAATEEPGSDEVPISDEETDPAEELAAEGEPDPAEEAAESDEQPHDEPRWEKSLARWEKERADITLTGDLREDILIIARSQLGYSADRTCYEEDITGHKRYYTRYGEWYGAKYSDWCDIFASFCIYYAGYESYPSESSCIRHMLRLKQAGYWREWNSYMPQKGDIVFFALDKESMMPSHVGLVEEVVPGEGDLPGYLVTIEGNVSDPNGPNACVRRVIRSFDRVLGYGTYEKGKTYPETYSVRFPSWRVIDADSIYFVEYPSEEVLRFLGLCGSQYYAYWFPEGPAADAEDPQEQLPLGVHLDPVLKPQRREMNMRFCGEDGGK